MNTINQNPVASRQDDSSPNYVDELLGSFFRSEMPQPWPDLLGLKIEDRGLRIEDESRAKSPSRHDILPFDDLARDPHYPMLTPPSSMLNTRSSRRSRLVLAASVALLFLGSWWLVQKFSATSPSPAPSAGKMIGSKPKTGSSNSSRLSPTLPAR